MNSPHPGNPPAGPAPHGATPQHAPPWGVVRRRLIPCLDVDQGRVVKGVRFNALRDAGDPVEVGRRYAAAGADELFFLDISASHQARKTMLHVVERLAEEVFIPLSVGGGVATVDDIRATLRAGADKVAINSAAVADPTLIERAAQCFGNQCIVVAIDARARGDGGWEIFTHGGRRPTGLDAVAWAQRAVQLGAGELLVTSMDRDGTRTGFDVALLRAVRSVVDCPIVASGGVGELGHLLEGLKEGGADAVLAASIFHFGEYSIPEAKAFLARHGIVVRL